jgi:hypothetical protein
MARLRERRPIAKRMDLSSVSVKLIRMEVTEATKIDEENGVHKRRTE